MNFMMFPLKGILNRIKFLVDLTIVVIRPQKYCHGGDHIIP